MRVLFCGSGRFAVPTLEALPPAGHEVVAVITQPPRPAGRGGKLRPTAVAEAAERLKLETRPTENINDPAMADWIRSLSPDVICVADFGQMVRLPVRETARIDAINLHGSLLPTLRGAAPINWAILRGCETTGVTTFSLVDRMDAGAMYVRKETPISPTETAEELKERLSRIGAEAVCETLELFHAGRPPGKAQDEALATRAPILTKADGLIDWSADARAIRNRVHGTWPWPGAQTIFQRHDGRQLHVTLARAAAWPAKPSAPAAAPGTIHSDLRVAAGDGELELLQIKPADKRLMTWRDFVNGQHVTPQDRFITIAAPP